MNGRKIEPERPQFGGEVLLYKDKGRNVRLEVQLENETVWLTLNKIAELFSTSKQAVSYHLNRIFKEGEILRAPTVKEILTVQNEGGRSIRRRLEHYNLDAIISVGYRVNSKRATQFRIWATQVLKKHLIEGYTVNQALLSQQVQKLEALQKAIKLIRHAKTGHKLDYQEATGLLDVIENYSYALGLLDDYDRQRLKVAHTSAGGRFRLTYAKVIKAVEEMRGKSGGTWLFGLEKDQSLKSSVAAIYQTFDGKELYPSAEEKAANLLYYLVKDHAFVDGNKRIAAAIFLWFMEKNALLYGADGTKRLANNTLVALTLLIAESRPEEKGTIVTLVVNLINRLN